MRSIGILAGGTALAHVITALAMPVSTRLFTPQDFSVAATFASLVGILVAASCLRFDMAIPLPDDEEKGINLLAVAATSALVSALLVGLAVWLIPPGLLARVRLGALAPFLPLLPVSVLIGGLYLALQMWHVRSKAFGAVARSRMFQSGAAAAGQLTLGALGFRPLGLIIGQMLNYGAGSLTLGARVLRRERRLLRRIGLAEMRAVFREYDRFPRYSVWEALANAAAIYAPILLIAAFAIGPEAGYLTLANFLLQVPMSLLGTATSQVYLSGAPAALREARLGAYTLEMLRGLVRLIAAPLFFLLPAAPAAFGIVFGAPWARSGILVAWMIPWFLFQFLSSPISTALHVTGRQRSAMILQIVGFALRVGSVALAATVARAWISEVYALSGFVFYAIYTVVVLRTVELPLRAIPPLARVGLPFAAAGLLLGGLVLVAAHFMAPLLSHGAIAG